MVEVYWALITLLWGITATGCSANCVRIDIWGGEVILTSPGDGARPIYSILYSLKREDLIN